MQSWDANWGCQASSHDTDKPGHATDNSSLCVAHTETVPVVPDVTDS